MRRQGVEGGGGADKGASPEYAGDESGEHEARIVGPADGGKGV